MHDVVRFDWSNGRSTRGQVFADSLVAGYESVRTISAHELSSGINTKGIRLTLLSDHHAERCGIDGFEILGKTEGFKGDGLPAYISEDIDVTDAGHAVFWRFVMRQDSHVSYSDVMTFNLRIRSLISPQPTNISRDDFILRVCRIYWRL